MKILQSIWADIRRGENIDLYITVVIAIGLVILNIFGVTTEKITAPVTLAVLGLLAITSLGTRHFIKERIDSLSEKILELLVGLNYLRLMKGDGIQKKLLSLEQLYIRL